MNAATDGEKCLDDGMRRDFTELAPVERMRVIDALCSNLSVLSASVTACVVSGARRRRAGGGHVRIQTRAQGVRCLHLSRV